MYLLVYTFMYAGKGKSEMRYFLTPSFGESKSHGGYKKKVERCFWETERS